MREKKEYTIEVGGKKLTFEFSNLAGQTNGSVLATYGGTSVLATVVMSERDANLDYLPLRVDYEERFYAAGKIIGSRFIRREGRASEEAILAGRLLDRTIRPLFDHRVRRDIQVVVTVVAYDEENDPDFLGLVAASAALSVSDIPFKGPAAGVRVAKIGDAFMVNPKTADLHKDETKFEIFAAGPKNLINMIELAGLEASHEEIVAAATLATEENAKLIDFQNQIAKEIGKSKSDVAKFEVDAKLREAVETFLAAHLEEAMYGANGTYHERTKATHEALNAHVKETVPDADHKHVTYILDEVMDKAVHANILGKERRPDGRKLNEVRAISGETGLFARTHGSAVFMRGNTHALAVTTLGAPGAEQLIETMETTGKRHFLLHYNFPPYSVGEIGPFRGPGRREIGHGNLARNAIEPLLPKKEEFPYTIRVVSEILSSNGSSSMATTCATSLSLMDAGVPLKKPAAGIAMGLVMDEEGKSYKVITDIQGPEDHFGDMDFKVAGTDAGVNAIQLDTKVEGITIEIIKATLEQAKEARMHILGVMKTVIDAPRPALSKFVPSIITIIIDPKKIGMVIGPGGKTINGMIEKYALAGIDIEEDGKVFVSAMDKAAAEKAADEIRGMTKEFTVGETVQGNIVKILDFGAIVDLGGGQDGMIHVSELKEGYVKKVEDVVKLGDFVRAKVIRAEDGKIGLSIKQLDK